MSAWRDQPSNCPKEKAVQKDQSDLEQDLSVPFGKKLAEENESSQRLQQQVKLKRQNKLLQIVKLKRQKKTNKKKQHTGKMAEDVRRRPEGCLEMWRLCVMSYFRFFRENRTAVQAYMRDSLSTCQW